MDGWMDAGVGNDLAATTNSSTCISPPPWPPPPGPPSSQPPAAHPQPPPTPHPPSPHHVTPHPALVTFVALGNGAPDLSANIAAIQSGEVLLSAGGITGAAMFVQCIVAAEVRGWGVEFELGKLAIAAQHFFQPVPSTPPHPNHLPEHQPKAATNPTTQTTTRHPPRS